jgi:hypothetical protein
MRAIPTNKKWQLYWYWVNKAGDILCKLNWHDEMEKDRSTWDEPQTWCRCCGKEYYWQDNKWKEPV